MNDNRAPAGVSLFYPITLTPSEDRPKELMGLEREPLI